MYPEWRRSIQLSQSRRTTLKALDALIKESEIALAHMEEDEIFGLMFETGLDSDGLPIDLAFYSRARALQEQLDRLRLARHKVVWDGLLWPFSWIFRFLIRYVLGFLGHYAIIWGVLRTIFFCFCFIFLDTMIGFGVMTIATIGTKVYQMKKDQAEREFGRDIFKKRSR